MYNMAFVLGCTASNIAKHRGLYCFITLFDADGFEVGPCEELPRHDIGYFRYGPETAGSTEIWRNKFEPSCTRDDAHM